MLGGKVRGFVGRSQGVNVHGAVSTGWQPVGVQQMLAAIVLPHNPTSRVPSGVHPRELRR